MPSTAIKDKNAKLDTLNHRGQAILKECEKTGLSAEQDLTLEAIHQEMKALREEIERETKLDEKKADLADMDRFINDPVRKIPHGVNGDDSERKTLERAGWEFKAGMAYKQTSLGTGVAMFSEDVLFGEIPTRDPEASNFYKSTRASMAPEYKSAYEHYIKLTATAPQGAAWSMLGGNEQKALSEGQDTAGGFLVPPDVQAEMLVRAAQMAIMRSKARVQPTNRDVLRWPAVKGNAGTYNGVSGSSIYSSGFVGSWVGETPAFSDTDPSFQTLDIPVKKLRVATKLSNDFVADAAVNVLAFLAQNGAENMALTEDQGFINGDGSALQPLGILNAGIATFDVEGTGSANVIANTTSDPGSSAKLVTGAYALPAQYASRASWLMRRTIEGKIRGLVDASNRPLWPPLTGSAFAGPQPELLGLPVLHSDWMPSDGTDANKVVLLGDLSQYIIAQRTQITSVVLRERFADSDQVGIILFERVGGGLFNTDAFRIGIV